MLEAIARDRLGDPCAAEDAVGRGLAVAGRDGLLLPFLLHPEPGLLTRCSRHRATHPSLVAGIGSIRSGTPTACTLREAERVCERLSQSELRVLRYLPTNLSQPEIAGELFVSVHTIKTHTQHLYAKLGAHSRAEAVKPARQSACCRPPRSSADQGRRQSDLARGSDPRSGEPDPLQPVH